MTTMIDLAENYGEALRKSAECLRHGGLVAVPTETVYGLAADACNAKAVERIYAAKGRPSFNPLIAHVSGVEMAQRFGEFDDRALELVQAFWPGSLTLVVPLKPDTGLMDAVTADLDTVALRNPMGAMADLAKRLDRPLAAPSANSSGRISATRAVHVEADLGDKVDIILDGGPCAVGLESTIVKCVDGEVTLLREGGVSREDIEAIVGSVGAIDNEKVEAPGMMLKHYAPHTPVRMNATEVDAGEAYLAFGDGDHAPGHAVAVDDLSPGRSLAEAATNLFAMLHDLDRSGADAIAVAPIPETGIGKAINDRLRRAAAGSAE